MEWLGNIVRPGAVAMTTRHAVQGSVDESPSHCGAHRAAPVPLSAKPAKNHGNFLLAFFGFSHLGIYHAVLGEVSTPSTWIRDLLPRCLDSLGHAVSLSAGNYDFVS